MDFDVFPDRPISAGSAAQALAWLRALAPDSPSMATLIDDV